MATKKTPKTRSPRTPKGSKRSKLDQLVKLLARQRKETVKALTLALAAELGSAKRAREAIETATCPPEIAPGVWRELMGLIYRERE